ncbi:pentatricopeptide repeat-containing protein At2g33680-like isoform X2 [Selaginella moellendorffii]|uniref:pentatricopeptide repeat-containing protein At2g33680-like isoform X2 n=1 Tax=Selaginella moellendorffii TaxID=88036 RepID=UPI000D1CAEF4|nr:pentatricopeptide repeat-containing protein At2g33680-like isoform X2 [Selaginella moellendorffii]|eukprot:XP_024529858.1 pentatricopeptide repeat-containing protein At2g33680-like isoform X2 [Selaginella moellendorffii]
MQMLQQPSVSSLLLALKECGSARDLLRGRIVHGDAIQSGLAADIFVATTLVSMYSKCGSMADARKVFDAMPSRNLVSWTALMLGYAQNGEPELALGLFQQLQHCATSLDRSTLLAALTACRNLAAKGQECESLRRSCLEKGADIHCLAAKNGLEEDIFVASSLVDMYVKCGSLVDALRVFRGIPRNNVVSWTAMVFGYVQNGEFATGLALFARMQLEGCDPGDQTFVAAIKACSGLAAKEEGRKRYGCKVVVKEKSLEKGRVIHSQAANCGCDQFVTSSLVEMYLKCGSVVDARRVFDGIPRKNVVSWTTLILGYVQVGRPMVALELFALMQQEGCSPDAKTFVVALQACASLAAMEDEDEGKTKKSSKSLLLRKGTSIHFQAVQAGFSSDVFLGSSLINMYAKCGSILRAQEVFDLMKFHDVVSWTTLILGYAQNGEGEHALLLFQIALDKNLVNSQSFVAALKACTSPLEGLEDADGKLLKLERGMAVHSEAARRGYEPDIFVASTLVDFYAMCGSLEDASRVFNRMEKHNSVTWKAMLQACVHNGEAETALHLFACMNLEGFVPDSGAFSVALKACSSTGALEVGRSLHRELRISGLMDDTMVANCLLDFYGKCGSMVEAQEVFNSISSRDVISWTSLIAGYSQRGEIDRVFCLLRDMRDDGLDPNKVTLLAVLSACSHAGLVDRDMLGRANQLEEAVAMVKSMPHKANVVTWTIVLTACRKWKNVEVGRIAFESLLRLDSRHTAAHDLMANILENTQDNAAGF